MSSQFRRARLKLSAVRPGSVLRVSFTFSLCVAVVATAAIAALWAVLDSAGAFASFVRATNSLTSSSSTSHNALAGWLSFGRVMLITGGLTLVWVFAFTLLTTLGAFLYSLQSDFVGGVEATLAEVPARVDRR